MDEPSTYAQAHNLVRKTKGKAAEHACVQCGKPAREWALSRERQEEGMVWSPNPDDYSPMCRSCHVLYDIPEDRRKDVAAMRGHLGGTALAARRAADPEWAAKFAERMREVQRAGGLVHAERLRDDPEYAAERARLVTEGRALKEKEDPEFRAEMQAVRSRGGTAGGATTGKIRRQCAECDLVSTPGPLGRHQKLSGHTGFTVTP